MIIMKRFGIFLITIVTCIGSEVHVRAQNLDSLKARTLGLQQVVQLAITQSSAVKYVQNTNVNYFWRWKNFQSLFQAKSCTQRGSAQLQ